MEDDQKGFINYLVLAYHVYCTTPRDTSLVLKLLHHRFTHDLRGACTVIPARSPGLSSEEGEPMTPRSPVGTESLRDLDTNPQSSLVACPLLTSDPHTDAPENEQYASLLIRSLYKQLARRTHPDRFVSGGDGGTLFAIASEFHRKQELAGMIYCSLGIGIDISINFQLVYDQLRCELRRLIHHVENGLGPFGA